MNNIVGGDFITFQYRHRKEIAIGLIISLILGTAIFLFFYWKEDDVEPPTVVKKESKKKEKVEEDEEEAKVSVDIKGEINSPGIYSMKASERVIDVIERAGGLTENADTTVINLSKKVSDEMVIIIYSKEQVKNFEETKEKEKLLEEKCIHPDENSLENNACIEENSIVHSGKININTATKESLMTLNGIGESKAKDIVSYRESNGSYKTIEDIKKVPGIGESIYSQIKENITVG